MSRPGRVAGGERAATLLTRPQSKASGRGTRKPGNSAHACGPLQPCLLGTEGFSEATKKVTGPWGVLG